LDRFEELAAVLRSVKTWTAVSPGAGAPGFNPLTFADGCENGDTLPSIPGLSATKSNPIKAIKIKRARQSSALKPAAYCLHLTAREGR